MLVVSTTLWEVAGDSPASAATIAREILDLGATGIELDPRIGQGGFAELAEGLRNAGGTIVALEAVCPHPSQFSREVPRPGLFSLSEPDRDRRELAVRLTRKTLETAIELRARTVVVALGKMPDPTPEDEQTLSDVLLESGPESPLLARAVRTALERRAERIAPYVEAARRSLDELAPVAERLGVRLGIPNADDPFGLPGFQELERLLREMDGAPIGFWFDTGHAFALSVLGLRPVEAWLETFGTRTLGAHIRDAHYTREGGVEHDLAPTFGSVPFASLKALPIDALRCLKLPPTVDRGKVRAGLGAIR